MQRNTIALSQAWRNPEFRDIDGLVARIGNTRRAVMEPLEHKGQKVEGKYAIVDQHTGRYYGQATEKYRIVQNDEVLIPLALALQAENIPVSGVVRENDGEMTATLQIGNEFKMKDSPYRLVVTVRNSYNTLLAVQGESDLLRQICTNGMMGIAGICNSFKAKHLDGVEDAVNQWLAFFHQSEGKISLLPNIIERANSQMVSGGQMVALYRGIGIGQRNAEAIYRNLEQLVPEAKNRPISVWDGYNAGTAFYSHRGKGNDYTNREGINQLANLLTDNLNPIMDIGFRTLEAEQSA